MAEDKFSKRTFADSTATVEQTRGKQTIKDDLDNFITFEDWAVKQIILGRAKDEKGCAPLWEKELATAGNVVMERCGQQLLGRFAGVEVRGRDFVGVSAQIKQKMIFGQ